MIVHVVVPECPACLRRRATRANHVLGNGCFAEIKGETPDNETLEHRTSSTVAFLRPSAFRELERNTKCKATIDLRAKIPGFVEVHNGERRVMMTNSVWL